jgi:chromosome partitioning protein
VQVKIAVANLKGGVAKTTSAMFLAASLSRRGRTLLVDCDPQASALSWSEYAEEEGELGFNVVGLATKDVHKKVKGLEEDYEHVVLDTPPGEVGIVRAALLAAEVAVVAVQPRHMDVDRIRPTLDLIAEVEPLNDLSFWMLLTQVRRITREGRDARAAMEGMGLPVLGAEIPQLGFYADAFGDPIADLADYKRAAAELLGEEA